MHSLKIKGSLNESTIYVGESYKNTEKYLSSSNVVIIVDSNVYDHYHESFPSVKTIKIDTNEKIKSLATVSYIINELVETVDLNYYVYMDNYVGGGIAAADFNNDAAATATQLPISLEDESIHLLILLVLL